MDAHLRRDFGGDVFSAPLSDSGVHVLRLLRRRNLARTDRPHGFVRNNDVFPVGDGDDIVHSLELRKADIERRASFALFERFANAQRHL